MAGIYIHIPFCKKACHYCDFHFSTSLKNKEAFLVALKREIFLQKEYLKEPIKTIYFGGGTPSLLNQQEILEIFESLNKSFDLSQVEEVTLEANPDDLDDTKINQLKDTPVNRFSIGVQSFFDEDLKYMNRSHNAEQALRAIKTAQDKGFENLTLDLIYATPTLSDEQWNKNLEIVFELRVPHLSAYSLTVEPRTALAGMIKKGKRQSPDENISAIQFQALMDATERNGFIHYEISNFCKEGFYSRHNTNYWKNKKYLGLGPSSHSFNGQNRQWNVSNNIIYINSLKEDTISFELEKLSLNEKYNEYVLTSLRTIWGTDSAYVEANFGHQLASHLLKSSVSHINKGNLIQEKNVLFLTRQGKLFADLIASDLFI